MTETKTESNYEVPFQADDSQATPLDGERGQFIDAFEQTGEVGDTDPVADQASGPFVGQWQRLISSTNWEKGRIIYQWRTALMDAGASSTAYSDDAWAQRAGGVTAPHVGRLRRVYERFCDTYGSYPGLYWSHFLAAMDWDDAPLWLEGAMRSGWSISQMRTERWQAQGADPADRPSSSEPLAVEVDEDAPMPAQGGGRQEYEDVGDDHLPVGTAFEGPDFGDEADLAPSNASHDRSGLGAENSPTDTPPDRVQPFRDLPPLPTDLQEAVEAFKLSILRHKAGGWDEIAAEVVVQYLVGLRILLEAPSQ